MKSLSLLDLPQKQQIEHRRRHAARFHREPCIARRVELQARHAVCCQSRLAADYCDFSRAEARRIWRDNAPRRLSVGDSDDAESVGLAALMRSAQIWPPPCPDCRGAGRMADVMSGKNWRCEACAGTGKPRDARNVFHAYLRLAIRTQVLGEIKRRTSEAKSQAEMGKRARTASGNYRAGRGALRDVEQTDSHLTPSAGLRVWTGVLSRIGDPMDGAAVRGAPVDILDVSPLTGLHWLRPSDKLQRAYPRRNLQPAALWQRFLEAYLAEIRRSIKANRAEWRGLLTRARIVVACDCLRPDRCHRGALAELIVNAAGGAAEGELLSAVSRSSRREDRQASLMQDPPTKERGLDPSSATGD